MWNLASARAQLDRVLIVLLALVFIAGQLLPELGLTAPLGVLALAVVLLLLPSLRGLTLGLTAAFMVLGALLLGTQHAEAAEWLHAAGLNATLVTLFVFAPLFGIPVRIPAYTEALRRFYEVRVRTDLLLYAGTQALTQLLGVFINVGAVPVVYHLAFVRPYSERMVRLLANAMNRGFGGAIFWSPYFAAMALVTSSLSLRWSAVLPYMLGFSVLSFLVSAAMEWRALKQQDEREPDREPTAERGSSSVAAPARFPVSLGVYLGTAIAAILLLERALHAPMVLITCLAAVTYPLLWCALRGYAGVYGRGLLQHYRVTLPALKKEIALFLAAGFFSGSIGTIGFGNALPELIRQVPYLPAAASFSLLTVVLIVGTSLIGLHPIVPVTVLAHGVDPASIGITPVFFGVLLLGSWGISNTISPASAVNNLLAGLTGRTSIDFAKPNYLYALVMAGVLLVYLGLAFA